jgi:hypothetical protein
LQLNGADITVTIDGSNTTNGTTRDLTISNTSISTTSEVILNNQQTELQMVLLITLLKIAL